MPDVWLEWGGDFQVSATGGLQLAYGDDLARQRILRRLLTAVRGYVWHSDYGAGLPQKIGRFVSVPTLTSLVRSQITAETSVAPTPAPEVSVDASNAAQGAYVITIKYYSVATGEPVTLTFTP